MQEWKWQLPIGEWVRQFYSRPIVMNSFSRSQPGSTLEAKVHQVAKIGSSYLFFYTYMYEYVYGPWTV